MRRVKIRTETFGNYFVLETPALCWRDRLIKLMCYSENVDG